MEEQFVEAVERAINHVATDFQSKPDRFWNERDMHWCLFYYLKQEGIFQKRYATELIRAEFPTIKTFGEGRPARGHYDLVVLQPNSIATEVVRKLKPWTPWGEYLPLVEVLVAVEVKMWVARLPLGRTIWDIQKLTASQNKVKYPYFLNFVQLNFARREMQEYYQELRRYLMDLARQWSKIKFLCVPSNARIQPEPSDNWLSHS